MPVGGDGCFSSCSFQNTRFIAYRKSWRHDLWNPLSHDYMDTLVHISQTVNTFWSVDNTSLHAHCAVADSVSNRCIFVYWNANIAAGNPQILNLNLISSHQYYCRILLIVWGMFDVCILLEIGCTRVFSWLIVITNTTTEFVLATAGMEPGTIRIQIVWVRK
jgi:hypothetical protein